MVPQQQHQQQQYHHQNHNGAVGMSDPSKGIGGGGGKASVGPNPPPDGSTNGKGGGGSHHHQQPNAASSSTSTSMALCRPILSCFHPSNRNSISRNLCGAGYDSVAETLEYDYAYDDTARGAKEQPLPRIRERGEHYVDSYNGDPWGCGFGTNEESGIWMNSGDQAGTIMAALVWLLMLYSAATVTLLTVTEGIDPMLGMIYCTLCCMALACHAKTSFTDPGSVPRSAVPQESQRRDSASHSMCGQCQTFKPPMSHHCRICNRCVSRMDHHCPWMNNCVGAANLKHFMLFLIYTWTCAAYSLALFGWNYFFCADEDCTFHVIVVHLVRVMTVLCVGAFLFTSSMLMNVTYGLMTGIGTIDRLKKKATNTMSQSDEEPVPLRDVFGVGGYHTWPFPVDPLFEDHDRVVGFSSPQRLAREQSLMERRRPGMPAPDIMPAPTVELPNCVNDFLPV